MPHSATRLRTADRACLGALCLLLALAVSIRVYASRDGTVGSEPIGEAAAINLGEGVVVTRADAVRQEIRTSTCLRPVVADFVDPSPHGTDVSLVAPPNPNDRVVYVYRGWTLEGARAAMKLSVLHYMHRAAAVLHLSPASVRSELAVKLVVPAGCDASPDAVMTALRQGMPARP